MPLMNAFRALTAVLLSSVLVLQPSARAQGSDGAPCAPSWIPTFGEMPGVDGEVGALGVFDDGSGPALYAGGSFAHAGAVEAQRVARWDGTSWSPLNGGIQLATGSVAVHAFASFDDGSGPALYVGGAFRIVDGVRTRNVARWNGTSWSSVADGTGIGEVNALVVHDDGSGPALYAAGAFSSAGGVPVSNIARWDGTAWSPLGAGTNDTVHALAVYDDGSGAALYVGGSFTSAGGVAANRLARWDGTSFSPLGSGMNGHVRALAVFDGGGGAELCAGGFFTSAGGITANRVARWDGTSWSVLGTGVAGPSSSVGVMTVYDDGSGANLVVSGSFVEVGGQPALRIARWDGTSWSALGGGIQQGPGQQLVAGMTVFDDGNGPRLFVGGSFSRAHGLGLRIASWDGTAWAPPSRAPTHAVSHMKVLDDGNGPRLFVSGDFVTIGGVGSSGSSVWDGSSFSPLVSSGALQLAGGGDLAWLGGWLYSSTGRRWNGTSWSYYGGVFTGTDAEGLAVAVFDDGGGAALYVGGGFEGAQHGLTTVELDNVARWNGASYEPLGSGTNGVVADLEVLDDGSGPALWAGGSFTLAGGARAGSVARWDGASWHAVGRGIAGRVNALAAFGDGTASSIYAGGSFTVAGEVVAHRVARWDGTHWSALGSGLDDTVEALTVFDDGSGPALYAGGLFENAGGVPAARIARWDGTSWSALGGGISDQGLSSPAGEPVVLALASFDAGSGPALYVGGQYERATDSRDAFLAVWGCDGGGAATFCAGDASACPCGNAGNPGAGCDDAQGSGGVTVALVAQTASPHAATLAGTGYAPTSTPSVVALRSSALDPAQPTVFGDGLLCLSTSSLVRLGATTAAGGASQHAIGHAAGAGDFHYQLWYRSTPASFCDGLSAFNLSSGVRISWP